MRSRHLPFFLSLSVPLLGFILILVSLNLYQYFRAKQNIASASLIELSDIEINKVQAFFNTVSTRLNVVREWGKNGLLEVNKTVELNKKFFPFINNQKHFTGLLLADSTGSEYYLYRKDETLLTRSSKVTKNTTTMTWQRWSKPDQVQEQWEEKSDYDPRKRPWFVAPHKENKVNWTKTYTFFQTGKPGITASVSWVEPENPQKYMVFGLDMLAENISDLLAAQEKKREGILFWLNADAQYFLESTTSDSADIGDTDTAPDRLKIIQEAVNVWKADGKLSENVIPFTYNKQKWLVHIKHLTAGNNPIWIGVAASEKDLAAKLKKILLDIDVTDLIAAVAGGLFLLFLAWRFGWRVTTSSNRQISQDGLRKLIDDGENAHLEFKSTVRFNLRSGKTGKEIELAWLKAVTAFLNSEGGTLLIGVADDGTVLGMNVDNFENDDRCLLHVKNLLNQHIGAEFSRFLDIYLIPFNTSQVVVVECRKSPGPVFLKTGKNEEFYIRSGPSSTKLSPSRTISYLEKNR